MFPWWSCQIGGFAPPERGKDLWTLHSINITSLQDDGAGWKNVKKQEVVSLLHRELKRGEYRTAPSQTNSLLYTAALA
jgi:hypothetical protein